MIAELLPDSLCSITDHLDRNGLKSSGRLRFLSRLSLPQHSQPWARTLQIKVQVLPPLPTGAWTDFFKRFVVSNLQCLRGTTRNE